VIYLIHFDKPIGKARHYLGTCNDNRLEARLIEHARGHGARLTKAVADRGIPMWLARVFPELSFEQEKRIKRDVSFKNLCPLCCPMLERLKSQATLIDPKRPDAPPARAIWDARPPLNFPEPPDAEKAPANR